jgi:pantoate--beta-alanine ligase
MKRAPIEGAHLDRNAMRVTKTIEEIRAFVKEAHAGGKSVGLVPTMGALHEGHLSLVRQAKGQCDVVVISIFVNPAQFGPGEDFERYPRQLGEDIDRLGAYNVGAVFAPSASEMYPEGFATWVDPGLLAEPLEGSARPGHFRGVATVVLKLFNVVRPDIAYFGQKDFQQAVILRRMVEDLNLSPRLVLCPIVRDEDGLALSSRNAYLDAAERRAALALPRSLARAQEMVHAGEGQARPVAEAMQKILLAESRIRLDYAAIVHPATLAPVERITAGTVALVAARVGSVRLIDNAIFGPPGAAPELLLQLAITGPPITNLKARIPGLEAETIKLRIEACRQCAAINTIRLPPRDFLAQYVQRDYPDLNTVEIAVVGRCAPIRSETFLYRNQGKSSPFVKDLFELLGVNNFEEFKCRYILTDAVRCHSSGPHVPERAMQNCVQHLCSELELFPNLRTLVTLGDDAYISIQRFLLGRSPSSVLPFEEALGSRGWAEEKTSLSLLGERPLRILHCYHPTFGYRHSPSIAALLRE